MIAFFALPLVAFLVGFAALLNDYSHGNGEIASETSATEKEIR